MAIALTLTKDRDKAKKLSLSLAKPARFRVELFWDSVHDLDAHALLARNDGSGAKVSSLEEVLSTYNCSSTNPAGVLNPTPDGSFSAVDGALTHSGDQRTGIGADIDEVITIDGSRIRGHANEIPIFVTIHPPGAAKFSQVKDAGIRIISDQGAVLGEYRLSDEFGAFDAVQMGSLMLDPNGWSYVPVGVGFRGDFNDILGHFS